ncbi:MAG: molecular chaperone [Gammaproteobacteria bacterium]|nr:molecular chaperone [Gammaproteobacteria bacterium]
MQSKLTLNAVIVDEHTTLTYTEVCEYLNIPEALLIEMEEQGLFEVTVLPEKSKPCLKSKAINRIEAACRLHQQLGVNLSGAVLALELLDELQELRHRLAVLER